jgi:hypothetical protein
MAYRHGLWTCSKHQVDFRTATLGVRRVKQGRLGAHPILGDELRTPQRLKRNI